MDVGLSRIAVQLPGRMESVDDILTRTGHGPAERKMFARIYGLNQSPTLAEGESTEDLLAAAGRTALGGGTAELVLYGHTLLTQEFGYRGGFPDRLRKQLDLPDAAFYGISHINCVSVLRAVELARRYLARPQATAQERVLVLGGDHGSISDHSRLIRRTTVGGDGAVGFTVQRNSDGDSDTGSRRPRYRYSAGASGRDARFHRSLGMSDAEFALFGKVCAEGAVETVQRAARAAGLTADRLDWVMPHLSNRMFWRAFCAASGIAKDRIALDLIGEQAHNFGCDALMALEHADRQGRLRPGDRCALVSLGQGAYFQVVIVEVAEDAS
ncbi:MAG TPA: 3-oxoacyl-[acyl-carrier-protein] synthase III C-terminal domain-containing protein [Actinocrinis sp.]|nr:3-oxoacyl-[acyl-carrier-protein] synthase III C-terminal domain-containing protein [Actinocrinis sp.]